MKKNVTHKMNHQSRILNFYISKMNSSQLTYQRRIELILRIFYIYRISFSLLNGIYTTYAIHTRQKTSYCSKIFIRRINEILLDAQIKEWNKKLSTKPNAYDAPQDNKNITTTAPHHIQSLRNHNLVY